MVQMKRQPVDCRDCGCLRLITVSRATISIKPRPFCLCSRLILNMHLCLQVLMYDLRWRCTALWDIERLITKFSCLVARQSFLSSNDLLPYESVHCISLSAPPTSSPGIGAICCFPVELISNDHERIDLTLVSHERRHDFAHFCDDLHRSAISTAFGCARHCSAISSFVRFVAERRCFQL